MGPATARRRLWMCGWLVTLFGGGLGLILWAFEDNIAFYITPTELLSADHRGAQLHRLGGLVEGPIQHDEGFEGRAFHRFVVSDEVTHVDVAYQGIMPALFRSGKGVVAIGTWDEGRRLFQATTLLAKHDETYRPPPSGASHVSY